MMEVGRFFFVFEAVRTESRDRDAPRRPEDQQSLMAQTGIDKKQLKNWFTNARRRIWKPMQRSAASHDYDEGDGGYYEED